MNQVGKGKRIDCLPVVRGGSKLLVFGLFGGIIPPGQAGEHKNAVQVIAHAHAHDAIGKLFGYSRVLNVFKFGLPEAPGVSILAETIQQL